MVAPGREKRRLWNYLLLVAGFVLILYIGIRGIPDQTPSFPVEDLPQTSLIDYDYLFNKGMDYLFTRVYPELISGIHLFNYLPFDFYPDATSKSGGIGPLSTTFSDWDDLDVVASGYVAEWNVRFDHSAGNLLEEIEGPGSEEISAVYGEEAEETPENEGVPGDKTFSRPGTEEQHAAGGERKEPEEPQPRLFNYTVKPGETLWDIARKFDIDVATIAGVNPDLENVHRIKAGQEIRLMNIKGTIHRLHPGETLWDIARNYRIPQEEIIRVNGIENPDMLQVGQELILPGAKPMDLASRGWGNSFIWPLKGRISSGYGWRWGRFHHGIDIAVPTGTPVRASKSGRVIFSGRNGGYGLVVYIDHQDQTETRYAHNSRLLVRRGDYVYKGQVIAYSGNTGRSTGPHLHFEIRLKGKSVNPLRFLK